MVYRDKDARFEEKEDATESGDYIPFLIWPNSLVAQQRKNFLNFIYLFMVKKIIRAIKKKKKNHVGVCLLKH